MENKMQVIGLTGSVGSGKSTVGSWLEENFSVKLVMTDLLGHKAMETGTECYDAMVNKFGSRILDGDGRINRTKVSEIVFKDTEQLTWLNGIVHPWVKDYLKTNIEKEKECGKYDFYLLESAILFQTELDEMCDQVWYVDVNDQVRRERLKENRGYADEKIDSILEKQKENENFKKKCHLIIHNDKDKAYVLAQVREKFL